MKIGYMLGKYVKLFFQSGVRKFSIWKIDYFWVSIRNCFLREKKFMGINLFLWVAQVAPLSTTLSIVTPSSCSLTTFIIIQFDIFAFSLFFLCLLRKSWHLFALALIPLLLKHLKRSSAFLSTDDEITSSKLL